MGRRTVNNIQEATLELILDERMLEARLLAEAFEVTDPRASS